MRRRWGTLKEIDYRTSVGSIEWFKRHSNPIQHLSAYRRLHALVGHRIARRYVNSPIKVKLAAIRRYEEEKNAEESDTTTGQGPEAD